MTTYERYLGAKDFYNEAIIRLDDAKEKDNINAATYTLIKIELNCLMDDFEDRFNEQSIDQAKDQGEE